jgi:ferredoxin-nitrite reductase
MPLFLTNQSWKSFNPSNHGSDKIAKNSKLETRNLELPMSEQPLSALEQVKALVNPYAGHEVFARLAQGTTADITPQDDVVMRWHGLYRHRPLDAELFMLRLKLPGGAITAAQLAAVANVTERSGHPRINLTTRQDIEFHRLTLAMLPDVFAALDAVGLTTVGACGDQVRNVVACPVAGLDPHELLDTTPVTEALTRAFLANPAYANMPRKFKAAVCGCAEHCVPTEINDFSFVAARQSDGTLGFRLFVGGGLSSQPTMAQDLGVWIAATDAVAVMDAAVALFQAHGNREQRGKARVKHLIAEHGLDWFRSELAARVGHLLHDVAPLTAASSHADHLGVHSQHEVGLVYLGIPVPVGRVSTAQLRALVALAQGYGRGRLRITHQQNIVLADIPCVDLPAIEAQLQAAGLPVAAESWYGRLVVCTGKEFCNKSVAHTKSVALPLAEALTAAGVPPTFSLRMSGCPNGCGQHALADIGLQGTAVKGESGMEERFDLWVGGHAGAFAQRVQSRLRPEELAEAIIERVKSEG